MALAIRRVNALWYCDLVLRASAPVTPRAMGANYRHSKAVVAAGFREYQK